MFKIGDFSKLSQVSVKALRYYDKIGLLKPARVDPFTNYRYYSVEQLPRLNRILALKDLGLSLEQISRLLEDHLSTAELRGMLRLKQAEIQQLVKQEQARLARIERQLKLIDEQENSMLSYDVVIKNVEPVLIASVRDTLPSYPAVGQLFNEVYAYLGQFGMTGDCVAIWHDPEHKESDVDGEGAVFIKSSLPGNERVKVYQLPAETMASLIHHGSYQNFNQAYTALLTWINANGYQITGPNREIYLKGGSQQDEDSYVTEIQFPVKKF
ncbi:MAG: MerR family transcriptional regulator [Ardenticatenaceae bacterium]